MGRPAGAGPARMAGEHTHAPVSSDAAALLAGFLPCTATGLRPWISPCFRASRRCSCFTSMNPLLPPFQEATKTWHVFRWRRNSSMASINTMAPLAATTVCRMEGLAQCPACNVHCMILPWVVLPTSTGLPTSAKPALPVALSQLIS